MTVGILAPHATGVPGRLAGEADVLSRHREGEALRAWVAGLLRRRGVFGITRVGSLTGLDRVGIPVVQVTRPLALSNAVSQGKGLDDLSAAAAGIMEAVETWAAERIPPVALRTASASFFGRDVIELFAPWASVPAQGGWMFLDLPWIEGWDLLSAMPKPVPLALVDTVYTYPSFHPRIFPRVTTGLGAGASMKAAVVQACREILERDALARTQSTPYFFERYQLDLPSVASELAGPILDRIRRAGLLAGAWRAPTAHGLPAYRCHVMEAEWPLELAPMPAEGSACHVTHDHALAAALLEACQSRLAAIAGAREDITRRMYPSIHDREHLAEWREQLHMAGPVSFPPDDPVAPEEILDALLEALRRAGAHAVIVVPLFSDDDMEVHAVRVIAPPLCLRPGGRHG